MNLPVGTQGTDMERFEEVVVLRVGHRPGRDDRMTTHVGLTARALGADRVLFPSAAGDARRTVTDVTDRFGGPFSAEVVESPASVVRSWEGTVVHLTMYGLPVQDVLEDVRETPPEPLLVVVGAEKVPFDLYERADWNVAVTNQPHSEVAALAVFLDRLAEGNTLESTFTGGDRRVVPQAAGKLVESHEDAS